MKILETQKQETGVASTCPGPMTRAALIGLRNAGNLSKDCHYVITNPTVDGNLDVQEIILHAVNPTTLSTQAGILTSHNANAYQGIYDIDQDDVLEVTDHLENNIKGNTAITNFPFGENLVTGNQVYNSTLTVTGGTVTRNVITNGGNVTISAGRFIHNVVDTDANVVSSGANVDRNHFEAQSNSTISVGDFRENRVENDATIISSTSGDVDNCKFSGNSNSNISGTSNLDNIQVGTDANINVTAGNIINCEFRQYSNYTMSGGTLRESTVGNDADVTIIGQDNYENTFGNSCEYVQAGTGYIRYSKIEGNSTWINGNTNVSNVTAYAATVNTTGSSGTISICSFFRSYMANLRNIPSLTITDSNIRDRAIVETNGAARIYIVRSTITDGSRFLCGENSTINISNTNLDSYAYIQATGVGGVLTCNYTRISGYSYIRNLTTNTHTVDRCDVSGNSNIRFEGTSSDCRVYSSTANGGSSIYNNGTSTNCYIYYCTASSLAQIYTQSSQNTRMYYCNANAYGYVRTLNCNSGTHYLYYCNATSRGYVQMDNAGGRMYAVSATGQAIANKAGAGGNIYYSSFTAYFYAYITRTTGTSSGLFGQGRRTQTITNPINIAPYAIGAAWLNF